MAAFFTSSARQVTLASAWISGQRNRYDGAVTAFSKNIPITITQIVMATSRNAPQAKCGDSRVGVFTQIFALFD